MSHDLERVVSDRLHAAVPEPPDIPDLTDAVARRIRRRRVTRIGGLAALVVATVITPTVLIAGNAPAPSVPQPQPAVSSAPSGHHGVSPAPSYHPARRARRPWGATIVRADPGLPDFPLLGADGSLYSYRRNALVRIDPVTGRILARRPGTQGVVAGPVLAAGRLWLVSLAGRTARLTDYDLATLAADSRGPIALPFPHLRRGADPVSAGGPGGRLYVGIDGRIAVLDATTRRVVDGFDVPGGWIGALAVSPDGHRLYLGVTDNGLSQLQVRDAVTGRTLVAPIPVPDGNWGALTVTSGGLWEMLGFGHGAWVGFAPLDDLAHPAQVGTGGGGAPPYVSVGAGAVWIGGRDSILCADPRTGHVRARAMARPAAGDGSGDIFGAVAHAGGRFYALYDDDVSNVRGIARIHPPNACTD